MSDTTSILLVDGNHKDREYYAHRLQISSPDCNIVQAATGHSGLDLCDRQPIDCVILELDLPDISGFEFLLKLLPSPRHPQDRCHRPDRAFQSILIRTRLKNGAHAALGVNSLLTQ